MKKIDFLMVAVCAISVPALASAGEVSNGTAKEQIRITYSPESVSTAEGREHLERRIRQAAAEICGPQSLRRAGSLSILSANRNCFRQAVADAMSTIKLPGVATTR